MILAASPSMPLAHPGGGGSEPVPLRPTHKISVETWGLGVGGWGAMGETQYQDQARPPLETTGVRLSVERPTCPVGSLRCS